MTKEIIIDCAFYKDGVCASPINKTCEYCKNIDVSKCYHKQLIRLKQQHNDDTEEIAKLGLDVAILEQENKELKEKNETLNYQWHKQSEIGDEWYKVAEKYKTALEEIREILNNGCGIIENAKVVGLINEVLNND